MKCGRRNWWHAICDDASWALKRRVLVDLEAQLKEPRAIEQFLVTYTEERKRLAAAEETKRQRKETRWAR